MSELLFQGIQQDIKIFLLPPILCALFRAVFILWYWPYGSYAGKGAAIYHCFRYGFWWGMDWNAYVFFLPFLLLTLPGCFFPAYFAVGDAVRCVAVLVYSLALYAAFIGKMIFYAHYHDTYNYLVWQGKNAEKHNLADVFFNEHHGIILLLSFIPFAYLVWQVSCGLLSLPSVSFPAAEDGALRMALDGNILQHSHMIENDTLRYAFDVAIVLAAVAFYYFFRYGGTFLHDDKPEWDTIPSIVKRDIFLTRATVDDFVALEIVWKHPPDSLLSHGDEEDASLIDGVVPPEQSGMKWRALGTPPEAFRRVAKGPRIRPPRHIFLIVGESYAQCPLDEIYASLHIMDGGRRMRAEKHSAQLSNFLPAGKLSRPSIVSLMSGIFDAKLELNENERFWRGTVVTALPAQLARLGYRSLYWYGGNATYGNFNQFAPAVGFDEVRAAADFCPADAPRTWVGVYDHIFLEKAAELIKGMDDGVPTFHFIYTTSNHGPYKIPVADFGYDADKVMPDAPVRLRRDHAAQKVLGTYWYSDRAIERFVSSMREAFPDSLVIVTGDHAATPIPMNMGLLAREDVTLREAFCTSFVMLHPDIDQSLFAGNTIGGHMNIAPTIFEMIAPKGFVYYSLFSSLTEPVSCAVSPYHWLSREAIGPAEDGRWQGLDATGDTVATNQTRDGKSPFAKEIDGFNAITGWMVRHPELLRPVETLKER